MSDADAETNDLFEHIHQLEKQVAFLVVVWNKRDENYPTLARAVLNDVRDSIRSARKIGKVSVRDEVIGDLNRMASVISFLDKHHLLLDTWSGHTSSYGQKVRSIFPGGLPGHGRRS